MVGASVARAVDRVNGDIHTPQLGICPQGESPAAASLGLRPSRRDRRDH